MASVKKMQEEAMASIDTAKALVDKVLTIMEIVVVDPSIALTFSANPIGFLIQLLKHLGVTREEIELWLTNFLVYIIPVLEISVKAILLTNLRILRAFTKRFFPNNANRFLSTHGGAQPKVHFPRKCTPWLVERTAYA